MKTIGGLLAAAAASHPERLALLGDRPLTFLELDASASRVSRQLLARGLRPGDRVAYLDENSPRAAVALFGVVRAGMIYVPVHPQLQPTEIATLFADAAPGALLVGPGHQTALAQLPPAVVPPLVLPLTLDGIAELVETGAPPFPEVSPETVSMLLYTSGTTGRPKGVMLTHASCLYNAELQIDGYEIDAQTVAAVVVPHSVTAAINCMLLPALRCGGAVVYLPIGFRPEEFLQAVQRYRITHVQVVPTMVVRLLDCPALGKYDASSLRAVCYGSAPMPVSRLRDGLARLGPVFVQVYGQTECVAMATCLRRSDHRPDAGPRAVERLSSAGRPQPGMAVRIVDESGQELPLGSVGEVVIQGPNLMAGYWGNPEATAEALKDGWLHTGDLGRADADAYIYIVDREKDIIKSGGMTVSPSEVENVLYTHAAVLEAAVVGVPDPEWGEAVTAVVVLREGARVGAGELIEYCRPRLAPFKKPKQILFASALPKSPIGKILRRELRERYRQGFGDQEGRAFIVVEQESPIHTTLASGIAVVELNRPQVLNAMDDASLIAATDTLRDLSRNRDCRVVIIAGSPRSRAFCAGSDIREYVEITPAQIRQHGRYQHAMHRMIEQMPQPVIAAVHGYAVGGGMELALACDFRVAAADAQFGLPEVNIGVLPAGGGVWRMARLVGLARAVEMAMLGSTISAERAHACGLVHRVAPASEIRAAAMALAFELAAKEPVALAAIKQLCRHAFHADASMVEALELSLLSTCSTETAFQRLVRAKLERKREGTLG